MMRTLLRHLGSLPGLVLLLLALVAARPAQASHLLGGEMTYRYLDATGTNPSAPLRYEITLSVYTTCVGGFSSSTNIALYNQTTGALISNLSYPRTNTPTCIMSAPLPPGCTNTGASQQPYQIHTFVAIVNLPRSSAGYYAYFDSFARNATITNLASGGTEDLTLYTAMAPSTYANNSPVFVNQAIGLLCLNDTTVLLNNATDADGDRLVYSYGNAYSVGTAPATLTPPLNSVVYRTTPAPGPYSGPNPLGQSPNSAKIDPATGISKFYATVNAAQYVVAIDVKEYRTINGAEILIGTTRRDIQLIVGQCPPSDPPVVTSGSGPPTSNYTIEAGGTLTIPISSTQTAPTSNPTPHTLEMQVSSILLDGPGPYNATFAGNAGTPISTGNPTGSVTITATGVLPANSTTVGGNFVYTPTCSEVRVNPYNVLIQVQDKSCSGKLTATSLRITVTKPSGPTAIVGDDIICGLNTVHSYTSSGGTAPNVSWRIYPAGGGTINTSTSNPTQITWTTAGTYTLRARGVGQYGCFTDSVSKTIQVFPAATITVAGNQSICPGGSTTLTVSGAGPYTITGGSTTLTGNGPFTFSPTATTVYTITGTSGAGAGCAPSTQVTITVNQLPAANAGAAVSTCAGAPVTIGAAPVAGSTYSWSPATGLSSTTAANPTATITSTQTYTLTETNAAGCTNTGTVTVTVVPPPTAVPGANIAFCSGGSGTLGAAPVAGLTYSWSPATGLSSATAANPTVTLTNTTSAPVTTTYTLTVTSTGNCTSTGTITVTVNPIPVATPGANIAFCSGGSGTLGAAPVAGYSYSWSPATGLSSATAANPTVTLTNTTSAPVTTTYTLTVTSAGNCTSTGTVTVTVNPLPTVVPGANVAFCSGGSGTLGAAPVAGLTYSWSPATGLSSATAANPTVTLTNTTSAPVTTTYTLTVTGAGCSNTGTVDVTVNPIPVAATGANIAFCSGGSGTLGAAPVAGLTYSWSPATGLSSATVANPTVTLTNTTSAPVTTTYTLTVTNAGGCTSTGTVTVTVNPLPTVVPGANVAFCSGGSGTLGAAPVAGLTYSWSPATGLSSATAANPTVTLTNMTSAPVTTTYTLTVTGAGNCTNTGTVTVTVNPIPVATPGANVAFCSGGSGTLGAAPVAGYSYSWSPATGLSSATAANPTVTLTNTTSAPVTTTYTLTVTSADGCVGTGTTTVTVNPIPVATPGANIAFCSGGSGTLGAAPVAGYSYSWSPATGLSSATAANPTVTLTNTTSAPVTTTYTLTVTSAGNCTSTGTVTVTVNPLPTVVPGANVAFCSGGSGTLGAAPVAGLTYSWSPATGLSSATAANPTVTLTNTTSAPVTTTYTLTVADAGGCSNTGTVDVTVNPIPVAMPGANVAICSGGTGTLGSAPVAGLTYSWSPATGLSSATAANPTVTLTNTTNTATVTTYTLTVTGAGNCTSTGTVDVTVNPLPTAVPGANVAFCSGGSGTLGAAPVAGYTYSWSPATGLSSATAANPTVTLTNTTNTATVTTYTLTVTSATGCTNTGTVTVTVNPIPVAATGANVAFCSGGSGTLGAAPVAGYTYSWSPATGLSSATAANPTVTLTNTTSAPITTTYTLTVTSADGCVGTGTVDVTVNPLPTVVPGANIAFCSGGTGTLGAAPVTGLTYSWSPATGLSSATVANPTVTLTNTTSAPVTTTYTLTTTSAAGCASTGTVDVTVNPLPTVTPGAPVTICSGGTAMLGAPAVPGYAYAWSISTGLSSATAANPTVTLTNTTGAVMTLTYTLTVTNTTTFCTNTGTVVVTVNSVVTPGTIGADQTVCPGSMPAAFTSLIAAGGGTGTFDYQWESSLDNITWTPVVGATNVTYAPGPITVPTYFRRRVTSGACGTDVSNTVQLQLQQLLVSGVTLPPLPQQCPGAFITFTPTPTNAGINPTYQWFVNGTLVATTPTYSSSSLVQGDQVKVELTPTVGFCASGPATATVTINLVPTLLPTVTMSVKTAMPVCSGKPIVFSVDNTTNAGSTPIYQWLVDGQSVIGATAPTFSSTTLTDGQVVSVLLTAVLPCGERTVNSTGVAVQINLSADVEAGPDKEIMEGEDVTLDGTANGNFPVTWSPLLNLTFPTSNQLRPLVAPPVTTTYTVTGGIGQCADASSVTVTVTPRLTIPSAFSPNGDGVDDTWQISKIDTYANSRVTIFNRWGAKVYDQLNYDRSSEWNGTLNGQPVPVGTYYYIIKLPNGKAYTGPLTIVY